MKKNLIDKNWVSKLIDKIVFYEFTWEMFQYYKTIFYWLLFIFIVFSSIYSYFFVSSTHFAYVGIFLIVLQSAGLVFDRYVAKLYRCGDKNVKISVRFLILLSFVFPSQFTGYLYCIDSGKTIAKLVGKDKSGLIAKRFSLYYLLCRKWGVESIFSFWFYDGLGAFTYIGSGAEDQKATINSILFNFYKHGNDEVRNCLLSDPAFQCGAETILDWMEN